MGDYDGFDDVMYDRSLSGLYLLPISQTEHYGKLCQDIAVEVMSMHHCEDLRCASRSCLRSPRQDPAVIYSRIGRLW